MNHITEIIPEMEDMPDWMKEAFDSGQFFAECRKKVDHLEYKIDALMMEYCPLEMTNKQMDNWRKHQKLPNDHL